MIEGRARPAEGPYSERRPVDPNRSSQTLLLTLNIGGGYDTSLDELDPLGPTDRFTLPDDGYAVAVSGRVDYRRGTLAKYLSSYGRVFHTRAETAAGQPAGGDANLEIGAPIGRRNGVTAGIGASYMPTYLFNAYTALETQVEGGIVPDVGRTQGITEQRWLAGQAFAGVFRNWTPRQRTNVQYEGTVRQATSGPSTDTRLQYGSVRHLWTPRPVAQVLASYRYGRYQQEQIVNGIPLESHSGDVSLRLERRLSPSRSMLFAFGGGVTRAETASPVTEATTVSTLPTAFGGLQFDLTRSWTAGVDLRRDVTVLDSLAPQPYATNAVSGRIGGMVGVRTELSLSWASAFGETGDESFRTGTGIGHAQVMLTPGSAIFLAYTYYQHRLENVSFQQTGLPQRFTQSSIRLGVTLWVEPLR